jgi:hypothetical protein
VVIRDARPNKSKRFFSPAATTKNVLLHQVSGLGPDFRKPDQPHVQTAFSPIRQSRGGHGTASTLPEPKLRTLISNTVRETGLIAAQTKTPAIAGIAYGIAVDTHNLLALPNRRGSAMLATASGTG